MVANTTVRTSSSSGIGLGGALFIVLFVLKLGVGDTAVVDWSWWWVTAPLWGPIVLMLAIFLFIGVASAIIAVFVMIYKRIEKKRSAKKRAARLADRKAATNSSRIAPRR